MTDDKRERVAEALHRSTLTGTICKKIGHSFAECGYQGVYLNMADAAIGAMEEPEVPALIREMATALLKRGGVFVAWEDYIDEAEAALSVVARRYCTDYVDNGMGVAAFSRWSGLSESYVKRLLGDDK